jgi:MYXO-CTERM domain-containing protein
VKTLVLLAALATLVACPAAAAHGGGAARGFTSTITSVAPSTAGLTVEVQDGDDRLSLTNRSGKPVVVEGYDGEPYLRFDADGVFRNAHSPATYLNEDRYAKVALPTDADAKAPPAWTKVGDGDTYDWHDHRIHWMSTNDPPAVARAKDEAHHVFDWRVPGTVAGRPLTIAGSLDYEPPPSSKFSPLLLVPLAALAAAGALLWWRRRRVPA